MRPLMNYRRMASAAYLAIDGDRFGLLIDGADLAQLERVLARFDKLGEHSARNTVLHDFYVRAASTLTFDRLDS